MVKLRAVRSPKSATTAVAAAVVLAPQPMGPVESGVRAQIEASPRGGQRPGDAATAIRLASLLDLDSHSAMAGQLSRQLHTIMASLQAPRKKMKGGRISALTAVQRMTGSERTAGGQ